MTRLTTESVDVLVVGGGPAGAATAALLSRAGVQVTVLDRARFPRPKACAEFLSPQAARVLERLGVLDRIEAAGPARLDGLVIRAPGGALVRGDYAAAHGYRAHRDYALSLPRTTLDPLLLANARAAGATVEESTQVTQLEHDRRGRVVGVEARTGGETRRLRARLVVGADGLRSTVARRLGLARRASWPRRVGLTAHFARVEGVRPLGEMHVEADGFVGIADVGDGLVNVSLVVPASRGHELRGDAAGFLHRWIMARPQLAARFANAERVTPVRASGPYASHARRPWSPGAALVGDAADFFDPFTGEGIYAALRGGELLADIVAGERDALAHPVRLDRLLQAYARAHAAEFRGKQRVERIIGLCVAWPRVVDRAARVLSARRDLADLLVGVVGDFVPASRVLTVSYLSSIFLRSP